MRAVVVSDVRVRREGLAQLLADDSAIDVVGDAAPGADAVERLRQLRPDIVLLDPGDGARAHVRDLLESAPEAKVIVVGVAETDEDVIAWAEAGVSGYVDREASVDELVETVESVARGEVPVSPRIAATLLRRVAALAGTRTAAPPDVRLTPRELEIVALIDEGLSNKEIARRLHIELPTVKNHVHNVLDKLNVKRRAEAADVVRRLFPPPAGGNGRDRVIR